MTKTTLSGCSVFPGSDRKINYFLLYKMESSPDLETRLYFDILSSNYFIKTIMAPDIKYGYWRAIPVLLRVNRRLREAILPLLPTKFCEMLLILGSGRLDPDIDWWERRGFAIGLFVNCRDVLTKLYTSGVLSEYIRFYKIMCAFSGTFWELLSYFPLSAATNHDETIEIWKIPAVRNISEKLRRVCLGFTNSRNPFSDPGSIYYDMMKMETGLLNILTIWNSRGSISSNLIWCGDCYDVKYYTNYNDKKISHNLKQLPIPDTELSTYVFIPGSVSMYDIELIRRFYIKYVPLTAKYFDKLIPESELSRLRDLLHFCALFDLDLYQMWVASDMILV